MIVEKHWLWTHPAEPSLAVDGIDFSFERRSATGLQLRYEVKGRIGEIILPERAAPLRTNALWERTCFELFLRPAELTGYRELNFSPSSQWAAYDFSAHRTGMVQAALPAPPVIEATAGPDRLTVDVSISLDLPDEPYLMAAAAVIEEAWGGKSLWALSHAGGAPDFHHPSCFTLELPAARPA
ncbi:MAG TPA: DOMON-like domain-containing protein [Allosphingosinicella sp.]